MSVKVYLASTSPRRAELLSLLNIPFKTLKINVPEVKSSSETNFDYVWRLSREKAIAGIAQIDSDLPVIAADTVGEIDGILLEKPKDEADAFRMLKMLSGRTHKVLTGLTVANKQNMNTNVIETLVTFRELSDDEINAYITTKEPLDKAGAYGIQGYAGTFVLEIEGNYHSVIGLPLSHLINMLKPFL